MGNEQLTLVNFVARGAEPTEWKMVLVEVGPWAPPIDVQLRRLQERLYACVDAAIDGQLAEQFPETLGGEIVIQLDCYNLPRVEVGKLFNAFSRGALALPEYATDIAKSPFVKAISFDITFDSIQ